MPSPLLEKGDFLPQSKKIKKVDQLQFVMRKNQKTDFCAGYKRIG
jgi:hypothetical protein